MSVSTGSRRRLLVLVGGLDLFEELSSEFPANPVFAREAALAQKH